MITDATENALLYRRVIVKADSPKYPRRHGVIVGLSGSDALFVHVNLDEYRNAPARRREMFPLDHITVLPNKQGD